MQVLAFLFILKILILLNKEIKAPKGHKYLQKNLSNSIEPNKEINNTILPKEKLINNSPDVI
jgi:hypothetical protein